MVEKDVIQFSVSITTLLIFFFPQAVFQTLRSAGLANHPSLLGPGLLITVNSCIASACSYEPDLGLFYREKDILILQRASWSKLFLIICRRSTSLSFLHNRSSKHFYLPRTRILALVDADAYGLDIVSVYKNGSASMQHENESLAAERVEWIGVSASEALRYFLFRSRLE